MARPPPGQGATELDEEQSSVGCENPESVGEDASDLAPRMDQLRVRKNTEWPASVGPMMAVIRSTHSRTRRPTRCLCADAQTLSGIPQTQP